MNRVEYTCYTFLSFWIVVFWPEPASSWAEQTIQASIMPWSSPGGWFKVARSPPCLTITGFRMMLHQVPAEPKSAWIQGGDAVGKPKLLDEWMDFLLEVGVKMTHLVDDHFFGEFWINESWNFDFRNCCGGVHLRVWWLMVFDGWCSLISKTWEMVSRQEMKQWSMRMRTWSFFDVFCSWSWFDKKLLLTHLFRRNWDKVMCCSRVLDMFGRWRCCGFSLRRVQEEYDVWPI